MLILLAFWPLLLIPVALIWTALTSPTPPSAWGGEHNS
jgi:hypothetical protein